MTIESQLSTLTTQATSLFGEVIASQATITGKIAEINSSANSALINANISLTSKDATLADKTQTNLDKVATAADRVQTGADRTQTGLDRAQTNSDKVKTNLDKVATAADRVQTVADRVVTTSDRTSTSSDRTQSSADRVQTGLDKIAASNSAGTAAGNAAAVTAIFGTTNAFNAVLATATAQAQMAQNAASSASSILSQDLSAVSAALHRSPNAVTAMCIYDLSKDSDSGAWVDKVDNTSWMVEPLCGTWLTGGFGSELLARGDNLFTNGEGNASTLANALAIVDAAVPINGYTSALQIPAGAVLVAAYRNAPQVNGVIYALSLLVQMDDGSLPIVGQSSSTGDFSMQVKNSAGTASVVTLVAGSLYRVTTVFIADGTTPNTGVVRYASQSGKGFRITAMKFNLVGVLPSTYSASPELVSNGGFNDNVLNWTTDSGGTLVWSAGTLLATSSSTSDILARQSIVTTVGKTYNYQITFLSTNSAPAIEAATTPLSSSAYVGGTGTRTLVFTATSALTTIAIRGGGANSVATIDNITVKEVTTLATPYVPYSTQTNSYYQSSVDGKFYKLGAAFGTQVEVFRGNRSKFPRLAAIVAEASSVTIYDLTQPGRPMWMRFVGSAAGWNGSILGTPGYITSIAVVNGALCIGTGPNAYGLIQVSFIKDSSLIWLTNGHGGVDTLPLNKRNQPGHTFAVGTGVNLAALIGPSVNSVAVTVLPDAPFDTATGLQVPTIAVGTAGGVSVIRQDGTVSSHAFPYSVGYDGMSITGQYLLYGHAFAVNAFRFIKLSAITGTTFIGPSMHNSAVAGAYSLSLCGTMAGSQVSRRTAGIGVDIFKVNPANLGATLRAQVTDKSSTGFMVGDIRRAYLCNTEVESVSASELVVNGLFNTDLLGWTAANTGTGTSQWNSSGYMELTGFGASDRGARSQQVNTVVGKTYQVSFLKVAGAGIALQVTANNSSAVLDKFGDTLRPLGVHAYNFTAVTSITVLGLNCYEVGTVGLDNISIKEVIADRSYKAAGAAIFGTLVKSSVAV